MAGLCSLKASRVRSVRFDPEQNECFYCAIHSLLVEEITTGVNTYARCECIFSPIAPFNNDKLSYRFPLTKFLNANTSSNTKK